MTNLEWLMALSEEEFANWLYDQWLESMQYRWSSSKGGLVVWLKEERAEQTEPQTDEEYINNLPWTEVGNGEQTEPQTNADKFKRRKGASNDSRRTDKET